MFVTEKKHHATLSEADIEQFLTDRSPALMLIVAYLESGESWTMDKRGTGAEIQLINDLGSLVFEGYAKQYEPVLTSQVLDYIRAGRMIRILDWLDTSPDNKITDFLQRDDVSETFRTRLKTILQILIRAELLNRLFGVYKRKELKECL